MIKTKSKKRLTNNLIQTKGIVDGDQWSIKKHLSLDIEKNKKLCNSMSLMNERAIY